MTIIYFPTEKDIELRKKIHAYIKDKETFTIKEIMDKNKVGWASAVKAVDFLKGKGVVKIIKKKYHVNPEFKDKIDYSENTTLSKTFH